MFGIERIKIDDSLSQLFRSNSKEYQQYEAETKRFPATEFDVLVVVEGKTLLARDNLEKLRDLVTDLQLVDGTRGLISLFSARQAPAPGKLPAALFPSELPQGADYDKFIETVKANEIIRGKLLSEDGTLALIVLSLEPDVVASSKLEHRRSATSARSMADDLADTGLTSRAIGRAGDAARNPQRGRARRVDLQRRSAFSPAASSRSSSSASVSFMIVAAFPPLIAILLALGVLGWADFSLNMFLNVMTPLIMVISFSDSMQLTFAARDRLIAGPGQVHGVPRTPCWWSGRPACSPTAPPAFRSSRCSSPNSDLIRNFGEAGLAATIIALLAVLSLVPVFGVLLVRNEAAFAVKIPERRCRRPGAAQLLRLDRGAHGRAVPACSA